MERSLPGAELSAEGPASVIAAHGGGGCWQVTIIVFAPIEALSA